MKRLKTGLIGQHIGKSRFGRGLDLMCADHGITLDFSLIDTTEIPGFNFAEKAAELQATGWDGITVTHPYKTDAAAFAGTGATDIVTRLGSSNTLTFKPTLAAHNTDYLGFIAAWRAIMGDTRPGHVAIAGAGGVARALGPALADLGADDITIWDKAANLATDLANRIGPTARAIDIADAPHAIRAATGLVNATPLGMAHYGGSAFDPDLIATQNWAFDAVYTPTNTEFLTCAKQAGLKTLTGFDLFRFMALESFEIYTGIKPDTDKTLRALDALKPD